MGYTPENNPYIPGDPYSYDLAWMTEEVKKAQQVGENAQASADAALQSQIEAQQAKDLSMAWATGEDDGGPIPPGEPQYENNSKYYAQQAAASAQRASDDAADAHTDMLSAKDYADNIADPVSGLVTSWLTDHITNPSNPPIDTALMTAGAAADSKVTGEYIRHMYSDVTAKDIIFAIGGLSVNGQILNFGGSNNTRVHTAFNPLYCIKGTISCGSSYKFRVAYYSSIPVPDENQGYSNFVEYSGWVNNSSYTLKEGYYAVILAGYNNDDPITDAREIADNLTINMTVSDKDRLLTDTLKSVSNYNLWENGLYSATNGGLENSDYRIRFIGFIPSYIKMIYTGYHYMLRVLAWDASGNFVGVLHTDGTFAANTSNLKCPMYIDLTALRTSLPGYQFKIYAMKNQTPGVDPVNSADAINIYMIEDVIEKALADATFFKDKVVAVIGDSISTNDNSGVDCNIPEIEIESDDVGVTLSAYLTYYDVAAGLTINGHTYDASEIGTEVTFTPQLSDVGKKIGLPNNYNPTNTLVWWEVVQQYLGNKTIPVCWSGSSITSHEDSQLIRKTAHAWHPAQIRKCGIRTPGTMTRTAPDVIIIYRGVNDFSHSPYTLLTDDYFSNYNWQYPADDNISGGYGFKEGLCKTIGELRSAYPNAQIWLCTLNVFKRVNYSHFPTNNGINSLPQYNDAIREVADFMGCNVIDFDKDGITFENCYTGGYITDDPIIPTHPSNKGHKVMGLKAVADITAKYNNL